jgi:hypothetical protein
MMRRQPFEIVAARPCPSHALSVFEWCLHSRRPRTRVIGLPKHHHKVLTGVVLPASGLRGHGRPDRGSMAEQTYDVFISYNSKDRDLVHPIAQALEDAGVRPWIDRHLVPGAFTEQEIDEGMSHSKCCAVFVGPHGEGPWSSQERQVATARAAHEPSFRVFGVVLPGANGFGALPRFLQIRHALDLREGLSSTTLARLIDAIQGRSYSEDERSNEHDGADYDTHPRSHATVAHLHDNLDAVRESIRELKFTPIIGAGCSLVGRSYSAAWRELGQQLADLITFLEPQDPAVVYLRSLAKLPAYGVRIAPTRAGSEGTAPTPLQHLQLSLATLGAALAQLFARRMLESSGPVWDTSSFKVEVTPHNEAVRQLPTLLFDACLAAFRVKSSHELNNAHTGLGATGLYTRLLELTALLVPDAVRTNFAAESVAGLHTSDGEGVLHDLEVLRRRAHLDYEDAAQDHVDLALHQLEWVADALWHTFRYAAAAYPRTDEFAFQVSLLGSAARSRRSDLVSAAELGRVMLRPSIVNAWFHHFSGDPPSEMCRFYDSIARVLASQYASFKRRTSRLVPVAFSSNYDLEMEHALHRVSELDEFMVVVPVNLYRRGDPQGKHEWLLGHTRTSDSVDRPRWSVLGNDPKFAPGTTDGPLVVKLHGSPLHKLPTPDDISEDGRTDGVERIEHSITLSEFEFLRNIVWRDPLPDVFHRMLLEQGRSLFFLGQSLREWSTRLRLFNQVFPHMSKPAARGPLAMIAINRSYDPYRTAMLGSIGIHRWIGDLEEVAVTVEAVLGEGGRDDNS